MLPLRPSCPYSIRALPVSFLSFHSTINMGWQEYVDNNLMCAVDHEGRTLKAAALVGLDGSVWAQSPEFPEVTTEEVSNRQQGGSAYAQCASGAPGR